MAAPAAEDGGPAGDDDAEALADSSSGAAKSAAAELRAVRLRNRATQRKYRTRQKERLAAAEAEVSRLTRQLEASRLEQVHCRTMPIEIIQSHVLLSYLPGSVN